MTIAPERWLAALLLALLLNACGTREVVVQNAEFPEPLPASEARAITASIHRWITTKSRMWADGPAVYEATFSTIQAARGRKGGEQRASNVRQRISKEMA